MVRGDNHQYKWCTVIKAGAGQNTKLDKNTTQPSKSECRQCEGKTHSPGTCQVKTYHVGDTMGSVLRCILAWFKLTQERLANTVKYLRGRCCSTAHETGPHSIPPLHSKRVELPVQLADADCLWIHHIYLSLQQRQRQARGEQGISNAADFLTSPSFVRGSY